MEEAHPQSERRSRVRYAVNTEVRLIVMNEGRALTGRMLDLSRDGCRVRAGRTCSLATAAGIELTFRIRGIDFRLAGTIQWLDARHTAGIRFSPMPPRRSAVLEELLGELEGETQDRAAAHPTREAIKISPWPSDTARGSLHPRRQSRISISTTSSESGEPKPTRLPDRPPGRERRAEHRHTVDTRASVFFIDVRARFSGRILDISMSGCRIRTRDPFPVGIYRRVETQFKLDGIPFRLAGVVQALHDRFTVGIRLLDMSPRKRSQLAQLIEEIRSQEQRQ